MKLTAKQREYLARLEDRARILRARIASTQSRAASTEAARELHALTWALDTIRQLIPRD